MQTETLSYDIKYERTHTISDNISRASDLSEIKFDDIENGHNYNSGPLLQLTENDGLLNYIKTVYFYTGIGWCESLIFAELLSLTITKSNIGVLQWIYTIFGFVVCLLAMIGSISPSNVSLNGRAKVEIISWWKIVSFLLFSASLGLIMSPAIYVVNNANKIIFPLSILITNFIFLSVQIFTWTRKNMDGLELYGPLMSTVSGLIMIGIIEIVLFCLGFDKMACLLSFGTSIISIIVFSGLIFVDTLKAIESYNKSELNAIRCAVEIVLDLVNILMDLLNILMAIFGDSDD
jgi:FtsH-binding integral membrane protein